MPMRRRPLPRLQHITSTSAVFWVILALSFAPALLWIVDAPIRALEAPFRDQQARWEALEPRHYVYTVEVRCFCLRAARGPETVEMRDGKVVAVTAVENGRGVVLPPEAALTMRRVFSALMNAAAERAERVEVEYDSIFGFPARVWIDPRSDTHDEELGFTITYFRVLP